MINWQHGNLNTQNDAEINGTNPTQKSWEGVKHATCAALKKTPNLMRILSKANRQDITEREQQDAEMADGAKVYRTDKDSEPT